MNLLHQWHIGEILLPTESRLDDGLDLSAGDLGPFFQPVHAPLIISISPRASAIGRLAVPGSRR